MPRGALGVEIMTGVRNPVLFYQVASNAFLNPLTVVEVLAAELTVSHTIGALAANEYLRMSDLGFKCSRLPSVRPRVS